VLVDIQIDESRNFEKSRDRRGKWRHAFCKMHTLRSRRCSSKLLPRNRQTTNQSVSSSWYSESQTMRISI